MWRLELEARYTDKPEALFALPLGERKTRRGIEALANRISARIRHLTGDAIPGGTVCLAMLGPNGERVGMAA